MKSILKAIKNLFKEVVQITSWLAIYLYNHSSTPKLPKINKNVMIIGNGPSIQGFNFDYFIKQDYDLLCVNFFALDEDLFFKLRPKYYVIIDSEFYNPEKRKRYPEFKKLLDVLEKVDWDIDIISLSRQRLNTMNIHIRNIYLNNNPYCGNIKWLQKLLYGSNKGTFGYQNVINAALYFLLLCNVSRISLIGVENDWHRELYVDENNDVIRETVHFYGKRRLNITEKGEIKKGELYKYFYYYYITLYKYKMASEYAKIIESTITNYCTNSYIDVFEKKEHPSNT